MKVLVATSSKHGSTAEIAGAIGSMLRGRDMEPTITSPELVGSVTEYDAVILGSAVYAGRWMKPIRDMVDRLGDQLAERPVWLFSSGPIGDPPRPEEDPVDVAPIMEATRARGHAVFAGRLDKSKLGFGERAMVAAFKAPEGDFRDWDQIRSWAEEIADELASLSAYPPT
jgi:menaquinone-dependent protoporphyrinogen oxidase